MKTFDSHFIGGILLIVGTSIGGGMLALPVSTAQAGFVGSSLFLVASWLIMTLGALLVLEVNLYLPSGSNMVAMAQKTLGPIGQLFTWFSYLFLLYTLLSAYISGGSDVLQGLAAAVGLHLPKPVTSCLFTLSLGLIVYHGVRSVDFFNRGLMFLKLAIFFILIFLISPHISLPLLQHRDVAYITPAIMILITSFGFASIVPSLRTYFNDDIRKLRLVIVIGSLIPLGCYLAWNAALIGVLPLPNFEQILASGHTTSALTSALSHTIHSQWVTVFFSSFAAICMLTAFLGVSLGLFDFLADGLSKQKKGRQGYQVFACTFAPPLAVVLFYPNAYLKALHYAGIFCVLLLLLLPALMAYRGRYHSKMAGKYAVSGGKLMLLGVTTTAIGLLLIAMHQL